MDRPLYELLELIKIINKHLLFQILLFTIKNKDMGLTTDHKKLYQPNLDSNMDISVQELSIKIDKS